MLNILNVVGARPNFMKIAPLVAAMQRSSHLIQQQLVHTGQHYDAKMSQAFFDDLGLPKPDIDLNIGSGSHAEQTAGVMIAFERVCLQSKPDLVVVVGDVNSTLACTITAKKLGIPVAHVEAGLRSRDIGMPEEINRLCTDVLADYLFTTDQIASANLRAEGIAPERIFCVGNVMIDTLMRHRELARQRPLLNNWGLQAGHYLVVTLHRPTNVDDKVILTGILNALRTLATERPVIFPMHPRTRKMVQQFGLDHYFTKSDQPQGLWCTEPLGYLDFLNLNMHAQLILTDSGGLQEETTVLGVPCLTLRHNTERPITCEVGTNTIVGNDETVILENALAILSGQKRTGQIPEYWDGHAAERIVEILINHFSTTAHGHV
jgi:UDP-N-acetylglucosamine 2-epimerase (non-hydrolysing)